MILELTPSFEVMDPRFRKLALPYVHVEKLYTGCRWAAGRIPTDAGLRLFVHGLMEVGGLSEDERRNIDSQCANILANPVGHAQKDVDECKSKQK